MIKIGHAFLPNQEQIHAIVMGMRNPLNSWSKIDTYDSAVTNDGFILGDDDLDLAMRLAKAGSEHRKYMRMMNVIVNVNAPLYWWKEFDTYKIGTSTNSCSTMHKLHSVEFDVDQFSTDHLDDNGLLSLKFTINVLNAYRYEYNKTKNKNCWWNMIQLLPTSYNQMRTVCINYETLGNIYRQRKDHKLDEWRAFCDWIKCLPYSNLITREE